MTILEYLFVTGEDDWVPLLAVDGFARLSNLLDVEQRRTAVLAAIDELLVEGLADAGQLGDGGFVAWGLSPADALARIAKSYLVGSQDDWGFGTWFRNTPKGDAAALTVIEAEEAEASPDRRL